MLFLQILLQHAYNQNSRKNYASVPLALAAGGVGATVDRILGLSEKSN